MKWYTGLLILLLIPAVSSHANGDLMEALEWINSLPLNKNDAHKFNYNNECSKQERGSRKVVCQLNRFPTVALAVAKTLRGNSEIKPEIENLTRIQESVRVVPFIAEILEVSCTGNPEGKCLGFVQDWMENSIEGSLLKADPEAIALRRAMREQEPAKKMTTKADLIKIQEFFLKVGEIADLQGFLQIKTGRFFVNDPGGIAKPGTNQVLDDLIDSL